LTAAAHRPRQPSTWRIFAGICRSKGRVAGEQLDHALTDVPNRASLSVGVIHRALRTLVQRIVKQARPWKPLHQLRFKLLSSEAVRELTGTRLRSERASLRTTRWARVGTDNPSTGIVRLACGAFHSRPPQQPQNHPPLDTQSDIPFVDEGLSFWATATPDAASCSPAHLVHFPPHAVPLAARPAERQCTVGFTGN
jgi:hypothetical protein